MVEPVALDRDWLREHPLRPVDPDASKNDRGHVVILGGSRRSPGGLRLAAEAAFRAGAGKVQIATLECLGAALGVAVPEAGIFALAEGKDGELASVVEPQVQEVIERCDCLLIGPGMASEDAAGAWLERALETMSSKQSLVLDAAAIRAAPAHHKALPHAQAKCVLTPHAGEMAALLGCAEDSVEDDPLLALDSALEITRQIVALKGPTTFIGGRGSDTLAFPGGGPGLATGGSGDVLAGIVAALLSRGLEPLAATAWGVWLHGEAGRRLAEVQGPVGYLARELPPLVPSMMRGFD